MKHPILGCPIKESSIVPENGIIVTNGEILVTPEGMRELKKHLGYTDQDFIYEDFQKRLDSIKKCSDRAIRNLNEFRRAMHYRIDGKFHNTEIGTFKSTGTLRFERDECYIARPIEMPNPFMLAKPRILSV